MLPFSPHAYSVPLCSTKNPISSHDKKDTYNLLPTMGPYVSYMFVQYNMTSYCNFLLKFTYLSISISLRKE